MIDFCKLKMDLKSYLESAYLVSGFEAPIVESIDLDYMSEEMLIRKSKEYGLNIEDYEEKVSLKKKY